VRGEAAFALGLLGDPRKTMVERLIEVARTGSTSTRASALHAIGNISRNRADEEPGREGPPFGGAADVILAAVDDADADVRKSACYALGAPRSVREPASRAHPPHSGGRSIRCRARLSGLTASGACRAGRHIKCGGNTGTSAW
jgi:hypothetical protein